MSHEHRNANHRSLLMLDTEKKTVGWHKESCQPFVDRDIPVVRGRGFHNQYSDPMATRLVRSTSGELESI